MKTHSLGQTIFGLLLIGVGVGIALDVFNVLDFGSFAAAYWPSAIILLGVVSLVTNPRQFFWPLIIIIIGVALQIERLTDIDFEFWKLIWPTVLIVVGASLVAKKGWNKPDEDSRDRFDAFLAFSGQDARVVSKQFEGGNATALFGGIELDLNDTKLKDNKANLELFVLCGGVDIRVPEDWVVKVTCVPIMGGWEDKTTTPKDSKNAPTLTISGTCIMGGVSIKSGRKN